jgi:hypothetical protein
MTPVPANPKIYHITHLDNVAQIAHAGVIRSDAGMLSSGGGGTIVGMSSIKRRRLGEIEVTCHRGTKVGQYVPFYFCPRSIMLYILHMANHPDLTYHGGQRPIVHLQADLHAAVQWAERNGRRWAFSDRNAGTYVADFFNSLDDLDEVDWAAVASTDFRSMTVKEGKQAEFLMHESFPWELVERIGVFDDRIKAQVDAAIASAGHKPLVTVEPGWYY